MLMHLNALSTFVDYFAEVGKVRSHYVTPVNGIGKNTQRKTFSRSFFLTGSVKEECLPPERKVVSPSHSRVKPKT